MKLEIYPFSNGIACQNLNKIMKKKKEKKKEDQNKTFPHT